jgi:hypothetical protein
MRDRGTLCNSAAVTTINAELADSQKVRRGATTDSAGTTINASRSVLLRVLRFLRCTLSLDFSQ